MKCYTPFSTRLSGSAKETELRLRSIFQWQKKRPPALLLVLAVLLVLGCGGLVACQNRATPDVVTDYDKLALPLVQRTIDDELNLEAYECKTLWAKKGEKHTLILAQMLNAVHAAGMDDLFLGVWDEERQEFSGESYVIRGDSSVYTSWQGKDGAMYLLWSDNAIYQGQESSAGLGFFRFDGNTLTEVTELPQPALDCGLLETIPEAEQLLNREQSDWEHLKWSGWDEDYKAVPSGAGFEFYTTDPNWHPMDPDMEGQQWRYLGYVPFAYVSDLEELNPVKELIRKDRGSSCYYLGERPDRLEERSERIDMVVFAGEQTEESDGAVLQTYLVYGACAHDARGQGSVRPPFCIVLECGADGQPQRVSGNFDPKDIDVAQGMREIYYGLNLNTTLFLAGSSAPISWRSPVPNETVEVWPEGEPVYAAGDYWAWHRAENFTALCYHYRDEESDEERFDIYHMETTRADIRTYHGIMVGDSREKVINTYGVYLHDGAAEPYWDYEGDYLWYNEALESAEGNGETLIFWLEGDIVSRIEMNNMFN